MTQALLSTPIGPPLPGARDALPASVTIGYYSGGGGIATERRLLDHERTTSKG